MTPPSLASPSLRSRWLALAFLWPSLLATGSMGTTWSALPPAPAPPANAAQPDWLLDPAPYRAQVMRTEHPGEIVLDNGLVRRTFRLEPNGATVGLDNLTTGETLLRGVKPEARITLNGIPYDVGGLQGQPNYAYLKPDWLDAMTADPAALQCAGFEVGPTVERFAWKRVRHHAPDAAWPPPGVTLRMDYRMPDPGRGAKGAALPSGAGRKPLQKIRFDGAPALPTGWSLQVSQSHARSSFTNEGKVGEIYTPAHTYAYAEAPLPPGTHLVETTLDTGTDVSASWGPGMALVWADGRVVKLNAATGAYDAEKKPAFGVFDGQNEHVNLAKGQCSFAKPIKLRLRVDGEMVYAEAQLPGQTWIVLREIPLAAKAGLPARVRVGKLGRRGGAEDYPGEAGELGRLRVLEIAAFGPLEPALLKPSETMPGDQGTIVSVHYELYDGVPMMSKWITVRNSGDQPVTVDRFTSEILAVVEHNNSVEKREGVSLAKPRSLHLETDFAFGGFQYPNANRHVVHWRPDPQYTSQVNYLRQQPCLAVVEPTYGPAQDIQAGGTFESYRTFELVYDSTDRERRGLALKRFYRTVAPWVTENPLMHHMKVARPDAVRQAIDQAAEVGFEMIILSFGSGFNMDNEDPAYLGAWREVAEYARAKGIEIGSYSLLSSRRVGNGQAIVPPPGQKATHGTCPALTSEWGQAYFERLYRFFPKTGFTLLEHDGSYPGDVDITARPPLQKGEQDSRWVQWRIIAGFYQWCRANGVYLNVPDYYYLSGANKCGMGYREVNWSLPRAQQVIHTRQNIYDGTWTKTPSMGWMFVPLSQYHGGGAAATIEPLDQHRDHYARMMASNLAMGVQACYRGPRLYDTEATKALVQQWVDWFKQYRDILESDMVHGRRADGRDLDWMLHVNPQLQRKGLLAVFNPLPREVSKTIDVNLYYTGLTDTARVSVMGAASDSYPLARDYTIPLPVTVPAQSMCWYVIE